VFELGLFSEVIGIDVLAQAGQNEVDIEKLPTCLEEDSIRVDGYGNAVIFDVVYHPAPSPHTDSALTTRLDALNYKKDALSADKSVSEEEVTLFQAYGKTLKGQDTNLSQFTDFLTVFEKKRRDLYSGIKEIEGKLEELDKEIKDVQTQMHQDVDSSKRRVKITVIVLAEEDGPAEISLAYGVSPT
jgi:septal ring factor EnvC (AmiA/AmiB activator)